jgi:2-methylisocitrate lyase-like PEP mutase family enzyme
VSKIRAAVLARRSPSFVVIARTDARAVLGFDEAIARAGEALAAGADIAFVEAPQSLEEVAKIPRLVQGPCLLNMVSGGKTPSVGLDEAEAMGYRLAILPGILFRNAIATFDRVLGDLKAQRRLGSVSGTDNVSDGFRRFGLDEWAAIGRGGRQSEPNGSR